MESSILQRQFIVRSDTPPASPFGGQVWVDTSGNNTEQNSYNGSEWELATAVGPDTPDNPVDGSVWSDTGNDARKMYSGGQWVSVSASVTETPTVVGYEGAETQQYTIPASSQHTFTYNVGPGWYNKLEVGGTNTVFSPAGGRYVERVDVFNGVVGDYVTVREDDIPETDPLEVTEITFEPMLTSEVRVIYNNGTPNPRTTVVSANAHNIGSVEHTHTL